MHRVTKYLVGVWVQALTSMADAGNSIFDALVRIPYDVSQRLALGNQVGSKIVNRAYTDGANV